MVEPSEDLKLVFEKAIKDARTLNHEYVTVEHLLFSILCSEQLVALLKGYGADVDYIKTNLEHHPSSKEANHYVREASQCPFLTPDASSG